MRIEIFIETNGEEEKLIVDYRSNAGLLLEGSGKMYNCLSEVFFPAIEFIEHYFETSRHALND